MHLPARANNCISLFVGQGWWTLGSLVGWKSEEKKLFLSGAPFSFPHPRGLFVANADRMKSSSSSTPSKRSSSAGSHCSNQGDRPTFQRPECGSAARDRPTFQPRPFCRLLPCFHQPTFLPQRFSAARSPCRGSCDLRLESFASSIDGTDACPRMGGLTRRLK